MNILHRFRAGLFLSAFVSLVGCVWIALSQPMFKSASPLDLDSYRELMAHEVADIDDLADWYRENRDWFAVITPPGSDFVLRQPALPLVIPFTWRAFPPAFLNALGETIEYAYSVPTYKLRIVENRTTRALEFYGSNGRLIYTQAAPLDYFPFFWLADRYPRLYSGKIAQRTVAQYEADYDPARVELLVNLIPADPEYVEPYLYAQARVLDYEAARNKKEDEGEIIMRLLGDPDGLAITDLRRVGNALQMDIVWPEEGFTNLVDVFTTRDLISEGGVWSMVAQGLATSGTNKTTWVTSNTWPFAAMTVASDWDSDGDGWSDGNELLVFHTDPGDADSLPVTLSGRADYDGLETGVVHVLVVTDEDSWAMARAVQLQAPSGGAYTSPPVANNHSYTVKGFVDLNGNETLDAVEPRGIYNGSPLFISNDVADIDLTLNDVPSISGTLSYSGAITGNVHVVAIMASNSWTGYEVMLPWVTGQASLEDDYQFASFPMSYTLTDLPAGEYYLRAFIDENGDGEYTLLEEGGQYAVDPIAVSNRVTGIDFTLALDTDSDGLPDWWEMEHFGGATGAGTGANDDPDGDGLSNADEYNLGTDPLQEDDVMQLAPPAVHIDYKNRTVERAKFTGFPAFIQPTNAPPVYYLKLIRDDDELYELGPSNCVPYYIQGKTYDLTLTVNPGLMSINGSAEYELYEQEYWFGQWREFQTLKDISWTTNTGTEIITDLYNGEVMSCETNPPFCGVIGYNPSDLKAEYTNAVIEANSFTDKMEDPLRTTSDCIDYSTKISYKLYDEYTRERLVQLTAADAGALQTERPWPNVEWGQNMARTYTDNLCAYVDAAYPYISTGSAYEVSSRLLNANETSLKYGEAKFRFRVMTESNQVYQLTWIEQFIPDPETNPNGTNQVLAAYTVKFIGTGSMVYIGRQSDEGSNPAYPYVNLRGPGRNDDFLLAPPKESLGNGTIKIDLLKVEITPSFDILVDGEDSTQYEAKVDPPGISGLSYEWSWSAPQGAGNNPSITFSAPNTEQTTVEQAKWFALPDDACDVDVLSTYTLRCSVMHNGHNIASADALLSITLIDPAGETSQPSITGFPSIVYNATQGIYRVTGYGNMSRFDAASEIYLPATSQFYYKTEVHENRHVLDLNNGFDGHTFFSVDELFARIEHITDASATGIVAKIQAEGNLFRDENNDMVDGLEGCLEVRAYQDSDPVAPLYFYYNCGRFSCP